MFKNPSPVPPRPHSNPTEQLSEKDHCVRNHEHLEQGELEWKVREKWITTYMEWLYEGIDRMLEVQGI
jgi:hypothetical protein